MGTFQKLNSISYWTKQAEKLTPKAKHKLKVIDWHRAHNKNTSLTARHFGLTRNTVRTWVTRFNEKGIPFLLIKTLSNTV